MAVNTWAVAVLWYGVGVLKKTTEELKELDGKTRKVTTMYGALHPKSDVNRLYAKRKGLGLGLGLGLGWAGFDELRKMYPGRGEQCWMVG